MPHLSQRNIFTTFIVTSLLLASCSNQESWSYKTWHNTLAHYNTFFNAEQKWLETVETTREGFKDDFRKPIQLFNYGTPESLKGNQSAMDEVIKKASTMIDKHPRSKWVDDAYLLNGKAYFMKGEVSAAIDLFEYVYEHFSDPEIKFSSQLWISRCLYQKKQWSDAEVLAQNLLKNPELPSSLIGEANWVLGSFQFALGKYAQAAPLLEIALVHSHGRMDKYRLHFALAQCYQFSKQFEMAEVHFNKTSKLNPPYELAFHARMAQVDILSAKQENYTKANKVLSKMLKDDKNIDYIGQIYVSMGKNELKAENINMAIKRFNQAIAQSNNKEQKTNAYLALGNFYFQKRAFEKAANYYDSANSNIDQNHPEFEAIVQRNEILSDLLKQIMIVYNNDSLLRMAIDPKWRAEKIAQAIEKEKKDADALAKAKTANSLKNQNAGNLNLPPTMSDMGAATTSANSSFPFYNALTKDKGKMEFEKNWGNRENRDFWKYVGKKSADPLTTVNDKDSISSKVLVRASDIKEKNIDTTALPANIPSGEKQFYAGIPMTSNAKAIAAKETENALFEAAKIYQDRLQEFNEAIRFYRQLLERFPKSENIPQALYELIKINRTIGDYTAADKWKAQLIAQHSKSVYIKMLETGGSLSDLAKTSTGNQKIDSLFNEMLSAFHEEKFDQAIAIKQRTDKEFAGNLLQTKFDYLQALSTIKKSELEKGIGLLQQLVIDYPSSDIAVRAKDIIEAHERLKKESESSTTKIDTSETKVNFTPFKSEETLEVIFDFAKGTNANMIRAAISDLNKKQFSFENLQVETNLQMGSYNVIRITQFSKPQIAKDFCEVFQQATGYFAEKGLYDYAVLPITKSNFLMLTKTLDLESYREFLKTQ